MAAFWNKILKKKEKESIAPAAPAKKEAAPRESVEVPARTYDGSKKSIIGILRSPHVTEKAAAGEALREYVFKVSPDANKYQVKQAVEARYNVQVDSVRTLTTSGKERRRGRQIGWKPGFKKAMVKIKEGQTIETQ